MERLVVGTEAKETVRLSANELLIELNKAYADEWLAYYQYWLAARMLARQHPNVLLVKELERIADEELGHAAKLAERILTLGGKLFPPKAWFEEAHCSYSEPPEDREGIIQMVIKAERCAIEVYEWMVRRTSRDSPITCQLILRILEEELEHEDTLKGLL